MSVMDRIRGKDSSLIGKMGRNAPTSGEMNSTPIRTRDQNKENNDILGNRNKERRVNVESSDSFSQHFELAANSKTIPKRKGSTYSLSCVNHSGSDAEFKIEIEGQTYNYCGKCASHLANNGFNVQRISGRSPKVSKEGRSPHGNKRRQELTAFLNSLKKLEQDYAKKGQGIQAVMTGFETERQNISQFYNEMLDYVNCIRQEHLRFIDDESERHSQICEIESSEITETLQEIQTMKEDIQLNFNKIVQQVDGQNYLECMNYYQQKRGVHEHRLSELGEQGSGVAFSSEECIEEKINSFKDFVDDISGILSSKSQAEY